MVLPDGGVVALWLEGGASLPIVWLGSEGEAQVVGASFQDFLSRLVSRRTGIADLDDQQGAAVPASWRKLRPTKRLAPLRAAFRRWLRGREPKPEQIPGARAEPVRAALVKACQPYWRGEPMHLRWKEFVVTLDDRRYDARSYAGGLKPLPDAARMRPVFAQLRALLGRPLRKAEIKVWGDGTVIAGDTTWKPAKPGSRGSGRARRASAWPRSDHGPDR
jgi:hypothetical protein